MKHPIFFPPSDLATKYLTGLKGVEVGGSAHNDFFLDTINVDYTKEITAYKKEEVRLVGHSREVDVVADACQLPFDDKSYDFVISSHVLEHIFSPIRAIIEWSRVARKYIFIIVPNKDVTFDKDKPLTPFQEILDRWEGTIKRPKDMPSDNHWSIWNPAGFREFCEGMEEGLNLKIVEFQEKDDKVGNGIAVLFEIV